MMPQVPQYVCIYKLTGGHLVAVNTSVIPITAATWDEAYVAGKAVADEYGMDAYEFVDSDGRPVEVPAGA